MCKIFITVRHGPSVENFNSDHAVPHPTHTFHLSSASPLFNEAP